MLSVKRCPLPQDALLSAYRQAGDYTDCFCTELDREVSHERFVFAFYTTPLFRLERLILKRAAARPSTDSEARRLAAGETDRFAAWRVEGRAENQLLLTDFRGQTRSWLMVMPGDGAGGKRTRLLFGSAVVAVRKAESGEASTRPGYRVLLGFHKFYSVLLLSSARSRLLNE